MDTQIRDRYRDTIFQEAMRCYGIAHNQIRCLNGFENFIYEFERGSQSYILRLGHSLRRSEVLIQGEVDWINYLATGGISVANAIPSENGKLVEVVEDGQGGQFLVTAFVKATGHPSWDVGWTPTLYATYGRLLGTMHALTAQYHPSEPAWTRPEWIENSRPVARMGSLLDFGWLAPFAEEWDSIALASVHPRW